LFATPEQNLRVIDDPAVRGMMLGLGANKGLTGLGLFPLAPSSIATVKPVRHLGEFKGLKIRVLASPFQLEMVKRMDASPVAMSLADVLPALQQGAIDGALGTIPVFGPLHYLDAAKYATEIGQPYVNTIAVMNKKWFEALPADLQKTVRDDAAATDQAIRPVVTDFYAAQRKAWADKGGEIIDLPGGEEEAFLAKIADIGDSLSKDKPDLHKAVDLVIESAGRHK
jgi:TRAP-type C4-dicarboxylate transport system substrate-binding protein